MSKVLDVLQMKEKDVLKFRAAGTHLELGRSFCWQRVIGAIENPTDVSVTFSRNTGQSAVLEFFAAPGATPIAGRFTSGNFINHIQAAFLGPRLLPLPEASDVNPFSIALCSTDSPLSEVLHMRGPISCEHPLKVMSDLRFYKNPKETDKGKQEAAEKAVTREEFPGDWTTLVPKFTACSAKVMDWSEGVLMLFVSIQLSAAPTAQTTERVGTTME
ncbi:hypothetical protein FD755_021751 [Muntiacus reevesi]|uniref:Small ribosomal subunit protein uS2 C-terminal domain-containing protein n=1 Tax=Muntiacus reevesi TaxID=9886 RepID=A0A5N3W2M3_MUNRE|nr:hypothetical protein FD755_021751 [Muntiacus reevesi]